MTWFLVLTARCQSDRGWDVAMKKRRLSDAEIGAQAEALVDAVFAGYPDWPKVNVYRHGDGWRATTLHGDTLHATAVKPTREAALEALRAGMVKVLD